MLRLQNGSFLFSSHCTFISESYLALFGMSSVCVCTFLCVVSMFPCFISFRSGEFCHATVSSGKSLSATASPVIHFWNKMTSLKYK